MAAAQDAKNVSERRRSAAALGGLAVGLVPYTLSRAEPLHIRYGHLVVAVGLVIGVVTLARTGTVARPVLVAVAVVATLIVIEPSDLRYHLGEQVRHLVGDEDYTTQRLVVGDREVPVEAERREALSEVLARLRTVARPGQTLFVGPSDLGTSAYNDTFVYFLFPDLVPASRYLELNPGTANRRGTPLADDLRRADYLVLTSEYNEFERSNPALRPIDNGLNGLVEQLFCVDVRSGPVSLMRRCSAKS